MILIIFDLPNKNEINTSNNEDRNLNRLIILPEEDNDLDTNIGRPIGNEYYSISNKLKYIFVFI